MDKIWKFFENMNEYLYVSDMDTDELVYMNRKTMHTYGVHSMEEVKGKKCYEVLQDVRCHAISAIRINCRRVSFGSGNTIIRSCRRP